MKLVHMADTHLGFRRYHRQTPNGMNQREADVAASFVSAIDKTIALAPDVVVIAGDVFDVPHPPNNAILLAHSQFMRLRAALPDVAIIAIAGNHDTPRTAETGRILNLFSQIGVTIVTEKPTRISLMNGELSVLAIPNHYRPLPPLLPDDTSRRNVLLMHDEVEGVITSFNRGHDVAVSVDDMNTARWDYVALGHYHVYHQVAPNAFYAGATDYTGSNIWGEFDREKDRPDAERGKGIIERDLDSGEHRFHLLPSRAVIDLPKIDGSKSTPAELTDEILFVVNSYADGIDGKVIRLVVENVPKHIVRDLNHRELRKIKARALHFQLETRTLEQEETVATLRDDKPKRPPIREYVLEHLQTREIPADMDRDALVALGMSYLDAADAKLAAAAGQ